MAEIKVTNNMESFLILLFVFVILGVIGGVIYPWYSLYLDWVFSFGW